MYTRTYKSDESETVIPEHYDGNAFTKPCEKDAAPAYMPFAAPQFEEKAESEPVGSGFTLSSIREKLPFKSISSLFNFAKDGEKKSFSFGTEEILICAAALYMFFSKSGDKECAIMLLILLFIN